ncbi:MAG TPA: hypothetical protein VGP24_12630 [Glaciihabitans sp.]|jgi:tetratricopeptide (TPR) repeat protein|nr:hypothetical protein [Glaciihabitans sp.]
MTNNLSGPAEIETDPIALAQVVASNKRRRRVRHWLLLISTPFTIAALLVATHLVGLAPRAERAIDQYNSASYSLSAETSASQLDRNYVEQWLPFFNRGAALAGGADFIAAIDDFEKALELAPEEHRCEVVVNLALSWERLADSYAEAGLFSGAALLYQTAATVLEGEECTPPEERTDGRDPGQERDEAGARVEAKRGAAEFFAQEEAEQAPSTPEERLEQLQDRGDDAAGDKADEDARERAQQGNGGFAEKPW